MDEKGTETSAPTGIILAGLKEARIDAGLSLRELGERTGIDYSLISKLERLRHGAQPRTARKLADSLGVEVRDLRRREPSADRE